MSEEQATVFVIDDDPGICEAIKRAVGSIGLNVETFGSPRDFLARGLPSGPSCLILDVRLSGASGLDFQNKLAMASIDIPIVFVTGYGDIPMTVRAMKAGAVEFLTKPFRDQDLLDAIEQALERDRALRAQRSQTADLRQRVQKLTDRERQVLRLVVGGKLNKEIAAELGIAEITVKVERSHLRHKLHAESVIDLVKMVEQLDAGSS